MAERFYLADHEWVVIDGNKAKVGISEFAQDQLGDVVYVELPDVGDELEKGDEFGTVESVKSVSEVYSPVSGTVVAINEDLEDAPETVNEDALEAGWFMELELDGEVDDSDFLTFEEYQATLD